MILTYCDICKKLLKQDCSDQVNLDFNSYGVSGFQRMEVQLCVPCAKLVISEMEKLGEKIQEEQSKESE